VVLNQTVTLVLNETDRTSPDRFGDLAEWHIAVELANTNPHQVTDPIIRIVRTVMLLCGGEYFADCDNAPRRVMEHGATRLQLRQPCEVRNSLTTAAPQRRPQHAQRRLDRPRLPLVHPPRRTHTPTLPGTPATPATGE